MDVLECLQALKERSADMKKINLRIYWARIAGRLMALLLASPLLVNAQGRDSPFARGLSGIQSDFYAWMTPIAIIAVMVVALLALAHRISGTVCAALIVGIVLGFGAPQIVVWVRDVFAV